MEVYLMKGKWEKPEMVVLVKRKSDEVILQGCKDSNGDPGGRKDACRKIGTSCGRCHL
jgi:hypothetical protein